MSAYVTPRITSTVAVTFVALALNPRDLTDINMPPTSSRLTSFSALHGWCHNKISAGPKLGSRFQNDVLAIDKSQKCRKCVICTTQWLPSPVSDDWWCNNWSSVCCQFTALKPRCCILPSVLQARKRVIIFILDHNSGVFGWWIFTHVEPMETGMSNLLCRVVSTITTCVSSHYLVKYCKLTSTPFSVKLRVQTALGRKCSVCWC